MKRILAISCLFLALPGAGQHYTAVNGSSYTGSLNVHNNPASIVNVPVKWDLTLFGFQDKHYTNVVDVFKYSLLSNPARSEYLVRQGDFARFGAANANLNLLNGRIGLNKKSAIAFGLNIRSYTDAKTSPYNSVDSLKKFGEFFGLNENNQGMTASLVSSSWAEIYFSYGRTLWENEFLRLNGGITLKANRGLAGIFANITNGRFQRIPATDPVQYLVNSAEVNWGYSSNLDRWNPGKGVGGNLGNFLSFTESGASADIGLELLIKPMAPETPATEESYFDYDWKLGLSFLDLGYAQYHFGKYSTAVSSILPNITDQRLDRSFDSTTKTLRNFKDSLSALYQFYGTYEGKYRINHPARMVLNVDRFVMDAFFINAELSVDLSKLPIRDNIRVRDINRLTITPRWETKRKGFYLPLYVNDRNQFWIGGAFRLGPILFGVHNWANIFSKNKITRGGGYFAIILRARDITGSKRYRGMDCPE